MHDVDHVVVEGGEEVGDWLHPLGLGHVVEDGPWVGCDPQDELGGEECLSGVGWEGIYLVSVGGGGGAGGRRGCSAD